MPECTTLTMHIFRNALEDGSILLRLGERQFRMYERSHLALVQQKGLRHQRLLPEDAARLFRLLGEVEALSAQWGAS